MIRKASIKDTPRAVSMLKDFVLSCRDYYGDHVDEFGSDHALRMFHAHLHPDALALALVDDEDTANGLLLALVTPPLVVPVWIAKETAWWVEPNCRGMEAFKMVEQYEEWAKARGAKLIGMSSMAGDKRVAAFYQRKGYHLAEQNFLKAVN